MQKNDMQREVLSEVQAGEGAGVKLHIGAGTLLLEGWVNIDNQPYEGIDAVLDVTQGLPFSDVQYVFAEHFIEHLPYDDALAFLKNCRSIMREDGILRLSTPNLDWVWLHQYHFGQWTGPGDAVRDCFWINKAFHAWGHKFLYNLPALRETLFEAGFAVVEEFEYGESAHPDLRGLERHERYLETPGITSLLVVEAHGRREAASELLPEPLADYREVIQLK